MIIDAISPLGARLLDTKRTWETAGASRTRKFMSIRASHSAAYNAETSDDAEPEGSASEDADDPDAAEKSVDSFAVATRSVSRQVTTPAGAEDAYASN